MQRALLRQCSHHCQHIGSDNPLVPIFLCCLWDAEILITNDDGVHSPALQDLERALMELGHVTIVAPGREMSAASQSITLHHPLRYHPLAANRYAVEGTPSDCVILASLRILERKPSLVVFGINRGSNGGDDIMYSGTVAAAFEAAQFTTRIARKVLEDGLPEGMILNVIFPEHWNGQVRLAPQGRKSGKTVLVENLDPRGREYFWLHEELHEDREPIRVEPLTDYQALEEGPFRSPPCSSIVPPTHSSTPSPAGAISSTLNPSNKRAPPAGALRLRRPLTRIC